MSQQTRTAKKRAKKQARDEGIEATLEGLYERGKKLSIMKRDADFERKQAQVGLASNILGLTAGAAATAAAAKNPALRKPKTSPAGPVTEKILDQTDKGRLGSKAKRVLKTPKGRAALIAAGAGGALGLQVANVGGDLVANRVLARESRVRKSDNAGRHAVITTRALTQDKRRSQEAAVAKNNDRKYTTAAMTAGAGLGGAAGAFAGTNIDRLGRGSSKAKFSAFGPMMRDAERGRIPLEAVNRENAARIIRRNKALKGQKMKTKLARNRYALGGAALFGAIGAGSGLNHAHDVKTARDKGFNAMLQQQMERDIYKSDGQSLISKSDRVEVTGHGKSLVEKRNFNAEADRQRRLGLYAGAGLGAGVVLGDAARRRMPIKAVELKDGTKRKVIDLPRGRGGKARLALLAAGSAAGAGGGIAAYRRGISERNNAYL